MRVRVQNRIDPPDGSAQRLRSKIGRRVDQNHAFAEPWLLITDQY
jgi:hypothetical protein